MAIPTDRLNPLHVKWASCYTTRSGYWQVGGVANQFAVVCSGHCTFSSQLQSGVRYMFVLSRRGVLLLAIGTGGSSLEL